MCYHIRVIAAVAIFAYALIGNGFGQRKTLMPLDTANRLHCRIGDALPVGLSCAYRGPIGTRFSTVGLEQSKNYNSNVWSVYGKIDSELEQRIFSIIVLTEQPNGHSYKLSIDGSTFYLQSAIAIDGLKDYDELKLSTKGQTVDKIMKRIVADK